MGWIGFDVTIVKDDVVDDDDDADDSADVVEVFSATATGLSFVSSRGVTTAMLDDVDATDGA